MTGLLNAIDDFVDLLMGRLGRFKQCDAMYWKRSDFGYACMKYRYHIGPHRNCNGEWR